MNKSAVGGLRSLVLLASLTAAFTAAAVDVRPLVKAGFDVGGDTMVRVTFTNGDTASIKGNEGFYVGGGLAFISAAKDMEFHLSLAYKFAVITASNGDVDWTRWPLEALAFYRFPRARVGGGLTYHLSPRLEGSGVVGGLDVSFKNALGAVLQADWLITPRIAVGARYTHLKYDPKGVFAGAESTKANGVGVAFSMNF